jgi:predicted secreted protein
MKHTRRFNGWLKGALAIILLGFALNFTGMRGVKGVRAQATEVQSSASGFSWEYQLDFTAPTLPSARQQASSITPGLNNQGVASDLQALGGSNFRLAMTGSQGIEQVRQVIYSPDIAGFIGGPAELEVDIPVGSLLDMTFKLESNLTTGYRWELASSESAGFAQTGEPAFTAESRGYGVPSVQTFVLHPKAVGNGKVKLVYRRPFGPDETATRHLHITFAAQAFGIDLSNPHPKVINSPAGSSKSSNASNPIAEIPVKGTLPTSFDWRAAGIVPDIRNQHGCGSCWAFGTVGIMESAIAKAGGPLTDLSEQFLVSCNTSGWDCSGGLTAHMWHYDTLGQNQTAIGAVLETDDPYTASNGTCSVIPNHPYTLSGWQFIVPNEWTMPTVDQIKNAIYTYGPVTAGVCADGGWYSYQGGVYNPSSNGCSGGTNHQIVLVGWDDATSTWILRNSWGSSWGEGGYMRIAWDPGGTTSRVGEGTSWVIWGYRIYLPLVLKVPAN